MIKQTEAERLAEILEQTDQMYPNADVSSVEVAAELRRQQAEIERLEKIIAKALAAQPRAEGTLAQQELVAWVDAGDLKKLRKGDVIRVIRNEEVYYSPFRYCGVLEECDYAYYRENSQFVYLEVGMEWVEKIVYTRKDCTTGAVYADRGDRVEVARAIKAAKGIKEKNT